jgi:23S rRNA G2069 N7-methylase RlmK/C1962 C5-methylase RlmI
MEAPQNHVQIEKHSWIVINVFEWMDEEINLIVNCV